MFRGVGEERKPVFLCNAQINVFVDSRLNEDGSTRLKIESYLSPPIIISLGPGQEMSFPPFTIVNS